MNLNSIKQSDAGDWAFFLVMMALFWAMAALGLTVGW